VPSDAALIEFLDQFIDGEDPEGREQAERALADLRRSYVPKDEFNGVSSLYAKTLRHLRGVLQAWTQGDPDKLAVLLHEAFLWQFGEAKPLSEESQPKSATP
jgi:hypothetical protein